MITNPCQEKREPGAKPVYILDLQSGGNRFRLDVVESSCERPRPCERIHWSSGCSYDYVNQCVLKSNSLEFSLREE